MSFGAIRLLAVLSLLLIAASSACSTPQRAVPGGTSLFADAAERASNAVGPGARRYIANTAGQGVRLRTECRDDAVTQGVLAERFEVIVDAVGSGACAGWSRVHSGSLVSWVRDGYLVASLPQADGGAAPEAVTGVAPSVSAAPSAPSGAQPATVAGPVPNATPRPSSFAFTATGGARVTLAEIEGVATVWGGPSRLTYLGLVASTPLPDSVCNAAGRYGGTTGAESIRNPSSAYGSLGSELSAYSPTATAPPVIRYRNATVATLTRASTDRGALDPDVFFNALCR